MREMEIKEIRTFSREETAKVGCSLGSLLKKGDIVCITGDLGTGKTVLVNGIAKALGISEHITSPTFTIVNEYEADTKLYHFDVYRISDVEEMFDIGFEEYLYGDGAVVIEWAELIKELIPEQNIWITIKKELSLGVDARIIEIRFNGEKYREYIERISTK